LRVGGWGLGVGGWGLGVEGWGLGVGGWGLGVGVQCGFRQNLIVPVTTRGKSGQALLKCVFSSRLTPNP